MDTGGTMKTTFDDKQVITIQQHGQKFPLYCEKYENGLAYAIRWFESTKQIYRIYITLEDGSQYMHQLSR